jgi:hypothetical protein
VEHRSGGGAEPLFFIHTRSLAEVVYHIPIEERKKASKCP